MAYRPETATIATETLTVGVEPAETAKEGGTRWQDWQPGLYLDGTPRPSLQPVTKIAAGTSISIKRAKLTFGDSPEGCFSLLQKQLARIEMFKRAAILPEGLSYTGRHVRHRVLDARGEAHDSCFLEVELPSAGRRYIKLAGSGCGLPLGSLQKQFPFWQVDVISGICLFADKFLLRTADGRKTSLTHSGFDLTAPVEEVCVDRRLSVYECEAVLGLSSFINALRHENPGSPGIAYLEIPRGAYYLYLVPAYVRGLLSADLFRRAMDEIDARHARLLSLYRKRLNFSCVEEVSPLTEIESYLREALSDGGLLDLGTALERLRKQPTWRRVLSVEPVNDWVEISRLAHAVVLIEHGRQSPGRAVVQVDDPLQERIRHRTSRLLRKLGETRHHAVLGVYPMQTVVPDVQRHPDSDLFAVQPAIPLDLACARRIVAATRPPIPVRTRCKKLGWDD